MKITFLVTCFSLASHAISPAGVVEIHLHKPLPKEFERDVTSFMDTFSGRSEILIAEDRTKTFIDRYQHVSKKGGLVIAYELTRDPKLSEGETRVTALYFSNDGKKIPTDKQEDWIWLSGVRVLRIDTETWKATREPQTVETGETAPPTLFFAKKLVVPRALFEATPLAEAVDFLRSMSRTGMEIDGTPAPFKLDFVVLDPDKRARPVDLDVKSIPLDELCEKVAAAAGMSVRFDTEAIVFHAGDLSPQPGK